MGSTTKTCRNTSVLLKPENPNGHLRKDVEAFRRQVWTKTAKLGKQAIFWTQYVDTNGMQMCQMWPFFTSYLDFWDN